MLRRIRGFVDRHVIGIVVMLIVCAVVSVRISQGEYTRAGMWFFAGVVVAGYLRVIRRMTKIGQPTPDYTIADFDRAMESPRLHELARLKANR